MSTTAGQITVLRVGLFPDPATLEQALKPLEGSHRMVTHDLHDQAQDGVDWDRIVDDILSSMKVITV